MNLSERYQVGRTIWLRSGPPWRLRWLPTTVARVANNTVHLAHIYEIGAVSVHRDVLRKYTRLTRPAGTL